MRKRNYTNLLLLFVFVLTMFPSCISTEETNYLQSINIPYKKVDFEAYKLSVNDIVMCQISTQDPEFRKVFEQVLSDEAAVVQAEGVNRYGYVGMGGGQNVLSNNNLYQIHKNGCIQLPFFGEINIVGKTQEEAETIIQEKMRESILDAQVALSLYNNTYYVLSDRGAVRGQYSIYKENMTIFQALGQIGLGTNVSLDYRNVVILRKGEDGTTQYKKFDIRTKDIVQSEFYYIKPNDMLYFPTSDKSFFNITSLSSFFSTILSPVTFLLMVTKLKFN